MGGDSSLVDGVQIQGVSLKLLRKHTDSRGSFTEVFQSSWDTCISPVQWSVVSSKPSTFRGMHLHRKHDEYICCLDGCCFVGLVDLRPALQDGVSDTRTLPWSMYKLHCQEPAVLTFPADILHGWYFPETSTHLQAVSESYEKYSSYDNHGVRWDDIDLPFSWPFDSCHVSDKAQSFPVMKELLTKLQPSTTTHVALESERSLGSS